MNRSAWAILLPVWTLVLLPALCTAGVVTHPCAPHESNQPAHESHGDDESGCSHESNCSQDPCRGLAARNEGQDSLAQALAAELVFVAELWLPSYESERCDSISAVPSLIFALPDLPCPESVMPLLI